MSIEEQTTTITYGAGIDEAIIETTLPKDLRKIQRMLREHPNDVKVISEDKQGLTVTVPKRYIQFKYTNKSTD